MINTATVKATNRKGGLLATNIYTSDIYYSDADSDYEQKKLAEKKAIHKEIRRVTDQTSEI